MGYDLIPVNKKVDELSIGAFSWPVMLQDSGMGYVLGYGAGRSPGSYVYKSGGNGSPSSNDGYKVSKAEAKMMAVVARGYVSVKRFINKEWAEIPEEQKNREKDFRVPNGNLIYQQETSEQFLEKMELFADFAEKSDGFKIS